MMSKRRIILWAYRPAPTCLPAQEWLPGTASVHSTCFGQSVRGVCVSSLCLQCVLRPWCGAARGLPRGFAPIGSTRFALLTQCE